MDWQISSGDLNVVRSTYTAAFHVVYGDKECDIRHIIDTERLRPRSYV